MTKVKLTAGKDHLEKLARTRDLPDALAEFVWNALDADAKQVEIHTVPNGMNGLASIVIRDNGHGITPERALEDFDTLGDSWKRAATTTQGGNVLHGKEGKGRLRFFSHARIAEWDSNSLVEGEVWNTKIQIDGVDLTEAEINSVKRDDQVEAGTVVKLIDPYMQGTADRADSIRHKLAQVFAPYLLANPAVKISFDSIKIDPARIILVEKDLGEFHAEFEGETLPACRVQVIEWEEIQGDRRLHFGGEKGIVLGSQPGNVRAPGFSFSAYAYSPFFDEISQANLIEFENLNDPRFNAICDQVREVVTDYFRERTSEEASEIIADLKSEGIYPYETDPTNHLERIERNVFDATTLAVSSYSPGFKQGDRKTKELTLNLLRQAIRHSPDEITPILHAVLGLPKSKVKEFAALLQKTQLSNIIAASALIADRVEVLTTLKQMVFDPKYKSSVKERAELDRFVAENTWIFDEHFAFSQPESGLTRVMRRVEETLGLPTTGRIIKKPDGTTGRVDLFFGRSVPQSRPEEAEFIVGELKRPSIKAGRKELSQVEDYADALARDPEFSGRRIRWTFFLVSGEFHDNIRGRIESTDRPIGQVVVQNNYEIWAVTWSDVITKAEARMAFVQRELDAQVTDQHIAERIERLQATILNKPEA